MAPPVMSREFLDRAERFRPSSDPDTATAQTVQLMCRQIQRSASDPAVIAAAKGSLTFKGGPGYRGDLQSSDCIARCAWWYAYARVKFIHHEPMINALFGEEQQLQLLIEPSVLLRTKDAAGDCAVYTSLVCALLKENGVPFEIVTIACDPSQPSMFSHVYARAVLADGDRLTLDASHGKYPGWEVPREHTFRKQVWDESGRPIDDAARWRGLHGYSRRGMGAMSCDYYEDGSPFNCFDTSGGTKVATPTAGSWTTFLQGALNRGITLASDVFAPKTTSQTINPRTGIIQNISTPGQAPLGISPLIAGTTGEIPGWVWIVGIGGVVLLLFRGKR